MRSFETVDREKGRAVKKRGLLLIDVSDGVLFVGFALFPSEVLWKKSVEIVGDVEEYYRPR